MTIPVWPSSLPQALQISGYSEEAASLTIASQPDTGPAKVRRRFTAGVRPVKGQITLTADQLQDFLDFFNTDLLGGSLRFQWAEPTDPLTSAEMRFVEPPSWSADSGFYQVMLSLEILP